MQNKEHYKEKLEDLLIRGFTHEICLYKKEQVPACKEACDFKHCTECNIYFKEWLNTEHKEPIKITLFEKTLLELSLQEGYKWIARDNDNDIYVYMDMPVKKKKKICMDY